MLPSAASAQGPQKFQNLQVFPKDIPRDTLLNIMRGFTEALGVRCTFCHVSEPGANGQERMNFASDDKVMKKKARFMLRMVDTLNHFTLANLPDRHDPPIVITCVTCHRGLSVPTTLENVLAEDITKFGTDSAIKHYADLRGDMTSGRYDFSESSVDDLARRLADQGKVADAITMLQMNQHYYPNSSDIDDQLGELYLKQGDKERAIVSFRAALTKRPTDQRAKQRLTELGAS